ncbi:hypothetical protein LZP69_09260 [Shewanella sp. AS1]|uniref:hypothetical protein n=1 Tax=Shewanella sp. AS1 TaxID=2907626 RepID=UPI001F44E6E7|nr:hypothetical protein [Shewanella sp. AS1]MCE9679362.1 hypothetical protein [Shewanella sp. AS1]
MGKQAISEKQFWLQRLSKTSLRALHILGVVGAGGGVILDTFNETWNHYWMLAMITGALLMLWEIIRDWRWLIQLKGVLTLAKLLLLLLFIPLAQYQHELVIVIILLSVIVSHGPAGLRHYSIIHRRRIDGKKEIKG